MRLVYEGDYRQRAIDALLAQYRDKPNILALVKALADAAQVVEDDAWNLLVSQTLESATGWLLDRWGALISVSRGSLDDTDYRALIEITIYSRRCRGNVEDLIYVLQTAARPGTVRYWGLYPHGYVLAIVRSKFMVPARRSVVRRLLDNNVRPAGVAGVHIEAVTGWFGPGGAGFGLGTFARLI